MKAAEIFRTSRSRTSTAMCRTQTLAVIGGRNVAETVEVVAADVRVEVADADAVAVAGTVVAEADEAAEVAAAVAVGATSPQAFLNLIFVCLKVKSQKWPRIFSRPFFPCVVGVNHR